MRFLFRTLALLLLLGTVLSFNGRLHFMLDNLSSFKVHFVIAFAVCIAAFLILRDRRWAIVAVIGLSMNAVPMLPWYFAPDRGEEFAVDRSIKVLMANISLRNRDYARLLELIDTEQPDVFGLVEVNAEWISGVASLNSRYPYRFEAPHQRYWGLALYSKLPISDAQLLELATGVPPVIVATLHTERGDVEFMLAHPRPPMSEMDTDLRDRQMEGMAQYIAESRLPVILAGDLNTAMWSPVYKDFVELSGLHNARAGSGVDGTWPPSPIFGVPIDHIMSSESIALRNFRVLPRIGSDHLPIAAEIILPGERLAYRQGGTNDAP